MYPRIWVQPVLRNLWPSDYTVLIPLRWKLDLAWQRALGRLRHNSDSTRSLRMAVAIRQRIPPCVPFSADHFRYVVSISLIGASNQ